jgi:hypothetical protein
MHSACAGCSCDAMRGRSARGLLASARMQRAGTAHGSQAAATAITPGRWTADPSRWPGEHIASVTCSGLPGTLGSCKHSSPVPWEAAAPPLDAVSGALSRRRKSLHDERSWHGLKTSSPIYAVLTLALRLRSTDHHEAAAAPDAGRASHLDAMPDAVMQRNDRCCSNVDAWTFHQVQQALEVFEEVPFLFDTTPAGRYVSECRRCQDAPAALAGYTAARVRNSATGAAASVDAVARLARFARRTTLSTLPGVTSARSRQISWSNRYVLSKTSFDQYICPLASPRPSCDATIFETLHALRRLYAVKAA